MTVTWAWVLTTARLRMTPVGHWDLPDLVRLKADPRSFALMLGGVKGPVEVAAELARDIQDWGRYGFGMWAVRAQRGKFLGVTALMHRPDGRGVALRFAFFPDVRGLGLASEAAGTALNYGHGTAGLERIVAVAREDNFASRAVLGGIGMSHSGEFRRNESLMYIYQSVLGRNGR
jgi:RimJ/RimL family protein N-acetyltransferase